MGISDKIEKAADEKEHKRREESFDELFSYFESCQQAGLTDIISEIQDITASGVYKHLIVTMVENKKSDDDIRCMGRLLHNRIIKTAFYKTGLKENFQNIFSNRFNINGTLDIYRFIESIYIMNIEREFDFNDTLDIYLSGLDERIVYAPHNFDEIDQEQIPEVDEEFFQMLLNVKWRDKETETLHNRLKDLMYESAGLVLDSSDVNVSLFDYNFIEENFIELLVACSTIYAGRILINPEDVIRTYRTFFKLIKTDLTTFKALPEKLSDINGGYLVCNECGYSYQLQPGESPDDFVKQCQCGGKLIFTKDLNEVMDNNVPEDIFIPIIVTLFLLAWLFAYYILQAFHWSNDPAGRLILFILTIILTILFYSIIKPLFGFFNWNLGLNIDEDEYQETLVCDKCHESYSLDSGGSVEEFPRKCTCGGKLICQKVEKEGVDLRNSRRLINIAFFALSFILLFLTLRAFNIDLISLSNGPWKYTVIILTLIFSVFLTTLILRLLNKIGFKIKYY